MRAACFPSMLHHARRGESQSSVYLMQVNQALPLLLDLLLEECWDTPGTLELLLCNLPQPDLRPVLREASEAGYVTSLNQYTCTNKVTWVECSVVFIAVVFRCSSLYEQDEANVFAEPSVMTAHVLPYLLQMAERYSESSALAQSLSAWAEDSAAQVQDSLAVCKELLPGTTLTYQSECVIRMCLTNSYARFKSMWLFILSLAATLTPAWLALLVDPRLHSTLCGLFTRAAFLLWLLKTSDDVRHLCDPSSLHASLREVCSLLSQNGVHFPSTLAAAVAGQLPAWQDGRSFSVCSMGKAFRPMRPRMKLPVDISGMLMPSECAALVNECCNCWCCSRPALGTLTKLCKSSVAPVCCIHHHVTCMQRRPARH